MVSNATASTQRIYLVVSDAEIYLGNVGTLASRTFSVSGSYIALGRSVRLAARERGQRDGYRSDPFRFAPGDTATWMLNGGRAALVGLR